MKKNYTIEKIEYFKKPKFIEVLNFQFSNEIMIANWEDKTKSNENSIGTWVIKYK